MQVGFAPIGIGMLLALLVLLITFILMLPMINMVPVPIGLLIIGLAIARLIA